MKDFLKLLILIALIIIAALQACARYDRERKPAFVADTTLNNDYYTTTVDQPLTLKVLENDKINKYGTLVFSQPAKGTIQIDTAAGFVYVPAKDFRGKEQFTYKVCADNICLNATVEVNVQN